MQRSSQSRVHVNHFDAVIHPFINRPLYPKDLQTLQVNIGRRCNQLCSHCHLDASPKHNDLMPAKIMREVLLLARNIKPELLDITGGAPELHPHLSSFIDEAHQFINRIQVRTNLTILSQTNMHRLLYFFKDRHVNLVASLPCYLKDEVDTQRGDGVFETSIQVLQQLNQFGFGVNPNLQLDLVYNPEGAFLPPQQSKLEITYREALYTKYNIVFNRLYTLTNMPIGRFLVYLQRHNREDHYRNLLTSSFNPITLDKLMCRHQIHVGSSGRLYDCDFNFALGTPLKIAELSHSQISRDVLLNREIVTGDHCFGCTAGYGSSCNGALDT